MTDHVIISCKTDPLNTNCTLTCEDGYEFDHSIKPFYLCGDSTYQYWDFKTADNPDGKLPQCIGDNIQQIGLTSLKKYTYTQIRIMEETKMLNYYGMH